MLEFTHCGRSQPFVLIEISSLLLLSTASMVLLCAFVRCCGRYLCGGRLRRHQLDSDLLDELDTSQLSYDDDGDVGLAPLQVSSTSASKAEQSMEQADDDMALPAYTDVVAEAVHVKAGSS